MADLAERRSVFHSEGDFQHAFGQVVHDLAQDLRVRLEVLQASREYLDLFCVYPATGAATAIEFKYVTNHWAGVGPATGERYELRSHAAVDLARLHFVHDLLRLERFCVDGRDGLAVFLTNAPTLWTAPPDGHVARDLAFRIHEGAHLTGVRTWGTGDYTPNDRTLGGSYQASWQPYSQLPGPNGEFRWLGLRVAPGEVLS